ADTILLSAATEVVHPTVKQIEKSYLLTIRTGPPMEDDMGGLWNDAAACTDHSADGGCRPAATRNRNRLGACGTNTRRGDNDGMPSFPRKGQTWLVDHSSPRLDTPSWSSTIKRRR